MAAKKSGFMEAIQAAFSMLSEIIMGSVFPMLHEQTDQLMEHVEKRALKLQDLIVQKLAVSLVNGLGIVFLIFALFYYLVEFQGMARTHVFLILGVALVVFAFIMKYQMLKQER